VRREGLARNAGGGAVYSAGRFEAGSRSGRACLPAGRLRAAGDEMCTGFRRYT